MEKQIFEYKDENNFRKLESALKKYNMLAYKKLYFEYFPELKKGEILGDKVGQDNGEDIYEVKLPTDALFIKVHGDIKLVYGIKDNLTTIITLKPEEILGEGHRSELTTYKGVMVSSQHAEKDMFKINLLNMIKKD